MTHRHFVYYGSAAMIVLFASMRGVGAGENWPHWRGPNGDGTSDSTNLPTVWGPDQNIVWKRALPSWSAGTPVIWGDRVFITSPSEPDPKTEQQDVQAEQPPRQRRGEDRARGPGRDDQDRGRGRFGGGRGRGFGFGRGARQRRDPGGSALLLICIAKQDGTVIW